MDKAFDAIAGTALGAYLIAVVVQGNGQAFVKEAASDWQYLEFLAAVYVLYMLHKSDFGGQIIDMLITTAIIALVIKMAATSDTNFTGALSDFANGKSGMFETVKKLVGAIPGSKPNG